VAALLSHLPLAVKPSQQQVLATPAHHYGIATFVAVFSREHGISKILLDTVLEVP
jgi:hypothetical protein